MDELYENKKIPNPSILIIDVDGYESKVISGAKELLKNKNLKKLIIEINYNNGPKILPMVKSFGFKEINRYNYEHDSRNTVGGVWIVSCIVRLQYGTPLYELRKNCIIIIKLARFKKSGKFSYFFLVKLEGSEVEGDGLL